MGRGLSVPSVRLLQVQAAAGWVLLWPILLAARNPAPGLAWSDVVGAGVVLAGMAGEATADRQLRAFRDNPANKGRIATAAPPHQAGAHAAVEAAARGRPQSLGDFEQFERPGIERQFGCRRPRH